ncbi:MAG: serine/threonine-protein kinase [Planctomycetota bacterium]
MSDQARFQRAEALFRSALGEPASERSSYVRERCGDDEALLGEVLSLLAADEHPTDHLDRPALGGEAGDPGAVLGGALSPSSPSSSPGDPDPERIGPYRVIQKLGEGGMGVVYEAEQTEPVRRRVALKIIKLGMDTKQVIGRFESERQALALMDHAHIARVLDAGSTEQGRPYFVMELVKGVPITSYCDRNSLSTSERLELFCQTCEAAQHAHQKGVIHRDLKPSNVLVEVRDGGGASAKVIDFGVAKATQQRLTEKTVYTALGQFIGTPAYMSPEQAEMSELDVDTRTDVYSLGVLLYELLTGLTPFDERTLREAGYGDIQRIIREEEPAKPSTRLSSLSGGDESERPATVSEIAKRRQTDPGGLTRRLRGDLDWIVMRALEKDRTRRYATASALAEDVRRHLRDEPVEAGPPSAGYRLGKLVRRNRGAVAAAAAVFVALAGGLAATGLAWRSEHAAREAEAAQRRRAEAAEIEATEAAGLAETRRHEAERARDEAEIVTEFLSDMLAAASPNRFGREVTVREVVDATAGSLDGAFEDQPLVEAEIRQVIAQTYRSLGVLDVGATHVDRAIELRERELGPEHRATLDARNSRAALLWSQGRYEEAERGHRAVLETRRRLFGENDRDTLVSELNLQSQLTALGRLDEAETLGLELVARTTATYGPDDRLTLNARNNLGSTYYSQGRYREAEALFRELHETHARVSGPEHPATLRALANVASQQRALGRYDEAEASYRQVVEARRRVLGDEHLDTLGSLDNLGLVLAQRGDHDEADALYADLVATATRVLGEDHPERLDALGNLGYLRFRQGRFAEAAEVHARVLERRRVVLGEEHPDTLVAMSNLAVQYAELDRADEAEALHREILATRRRVLGDDHPDTINSMHNLASTLRDLGRMEPAADLFREAADGYRATFGLEHRTTWREYNLLGYVLFRLGRHEEAKAVFAELLEAQRAVVGDEADETLRTITNLAAQYQQLGDVTGAEALYLEVIATRERVGEGDTAQVIWASDNLANLYLRAGRGKDAIPRFERVLAWRSEHLPPDAMPLLSARGGLAHAYWDQGRFEDAEPHLRIVLADQRDRFTADHPRLAATLVMLGSSLVELDRADEGEALVRECLEIRGRTLPADHWLLANTRSVLGGAIAAQGRYDEAEPILLEAWSGLDEVEGVPAARRREALDRLVELYESTGDAEEAAAWRERAGATRDP